jgi:hypothetical protein
MVAKVQFNIKIGKANVKKTEGWGTGEAAFGNRSKIGYASSSR